MMDLVRGVLVLFGLFYLVALPLWCLVIFLSIKRVEERLEGFEEDGEDPPEDGDRKVIPLFPDKVA